MNSKLLKIVTSLALCAMLLASVSACGSGNAAEDTAGSAPAAEEAADTAGTAEPEETETAAPAALADTTWTADLGEEYGAAVQGDEDTEPLTTLTLHFTDTSAFNVVGDVSFDYELNEDGTITVSNLNVGDTAINPDVFELTYTDGSLVLNTRINGGNAAVTFEQE